MSKTRHSEQQFALDLGTESATVQPQPLFSDLAAMDALLDQWQQQDWLRPLDVSFARLIGKLTAEQGEAPAPLLLLLAALTSHQVGRGHVCIDLAPLLHDAEATLALPPDDTGTASPASPVAPLSSSSLSSPGDLLGALTLNDCVSALKASCAVSDGSLTTPLVLNDSRLYLRRFWRYEQRIAEGIHSRLALPSPLADPNAAATDTLRHTLTILFGQHTDVDYQQLACALAARNRFAVITGGPGTGKTTTVVRLLAALQAVAGNSPERDGRKYRIRLAAPTGKAAARLNESIGGAIRNLPLEQLPGQVTPEDIPSQVTTLHRLLGSRPDTRQFRHHSDNPLLVDILVIDEASMVDVDLMASVFDALPASAQLILLGDKDQLASVDAGAVLGELCQRASEGHYTPDTADWLSAVTGQQLPEALQDENGLPLDQAVAMLRKSFRFDGSSGIGRLAESVNTNTLDSTMLAACRDGAFADVIWLNGGHPRPDRDQTLALIRDHAVDGSPQAFQNQGQGRPGRDGPMPAPVGYEHYLSLLQNPDAKTDYTRDDWDQLARDLLERFAEFQILCALRRGPFGVESINELITRQLHERKLISADKVWYSGRPVLVTGNDYNLGLMNGDIGITVEVPWDRDPQGRPKFTPRVAFPAADNGSAIRWISPSRLQQVETVYAMTVHKSQGSEFAHTCLVLPDRLSPVMTRELVYTGITRARNWFSLITGDAGVFTDSVQQQVVRASGLAQRLSQN